MPQMEKRSFVSIGGINLSDHTFTVPLDWNHPEASEKIKIFARKAWGGSSQENKYLVYLQGGPGFASPRPQSLSGWIKQAISLGFTVLLLDQRGTGIFV